MCLPNTHTCTSVWKKLDAFCSSGRIPHLLFHGASGTGKKTIVQQFIHKIYAVDEFTLEGTPSVKLYRNVMWVNCAQRKGIKFIREDLKFFAQTNVSSDVPFKTIVLLNADYLTNDAQSALRRCMEQYSQTTRFFGIVQNKRRLLFPILSRFCEIYIPDAIGHLGNLHQQQINALFENVSFGINPSEFIHKRLEDFIPNTSTPSVPQLLTIVSDLYDYGLSSIDLVHYLNTVSNIHVVEVLMQVNTEHIEFRNERLCMLRILQSWLFNCR